MKILNMILIVSLLSTNVFSNVQKVSLEATVPIAEVKTHKSFLHALSKDYESKAKQVFKGTKTKKISKFDLKGLKRVKRTINANIKAIKNKDSNFQQFKAYLVKNTVEEIKQTKRQLGTWVKTLPLTKLDVLINSLDPNKYFSEQYLYSTAFTRTEKIKSALKMLNSELNVYQSFSIKKVNLLTRKGIVRDLKAVDHNFSGGKASKKLKRVLLIAGISVAGVSLATWAIASASYKSKYNAQKSTLDSEYQKIQDGYNKEVELLKNELKGIRDGINQANANELTQLISQLENEYSTLQQNLTSAEKSHLEKNNFTRMVCNTYQAQDSYICNTSNYQSISGTTTCSVMCYKNVSTGQETLHEAPVCSSPFIPSNCFSQNIYDRDYNDGYSDGYSSGNSDGKRDGKTDGTKVGETDGDSKGYNDGYNNGYNIGFDDGDYEGYDLGYADGFQDLYNSGYDAGYSAGDNAGWNAAAAAHTPDPVDDDSWDDDDWDDSSDDDWDDDGWDDDGWDDDGWDDDGWDDDGWDDDGWDDDDTEDDDDWWDGWIKAPTDETDSGTASSRSIYTTGYAAGQADAKLLLNTLN